MKKLLLLSLLCLSACEAPEDSVGSGTTKGPKGPPMTAIQANGCAVSKSRGILTILCADGSSATSSVPALQVKDGNGVLLDGFVFMSSFGSSATVLLNKTSGHILSYDNAGSVSKYSRVFFDQANCFGRGFVYSSEFTLKNKVMLNNNAWPTNTQALKIVGFSTGRALLSQYQNGVCSASVGTTDKYAEVEAADFDVTDPLTLTLPLELVVE